MRSRPEPRHGIDGLTRPPNSPPLVARPKSSPITADFSLKAVAFPQAVPMLVRDHRDYDLAAIGDLDRLFASTVKCDA